MNLLPAIGFVVIVLVIILFISMATDSTKKKKRDIKDKIDPNAKIICLKIFALTDECQNAKNLLISNGIKADVFLSGGDSAYPGLTMTTGGARLMILEKDKEAALQLLESLVSNK